METSEIITVERVLAWRPCERYDEARLRHLIGAGLTLEQVLGKRIPAKDKVWVATRPGVLSPVQEKAWLEMVVCRAVRTHCLRCGEPEVETWAEKYLSGEDRDAAAVKAAAEAAGAEAAPAAWSAATDAAWSAAYAAAEAAPAEAAPAEAAGAAWSAYAYASWSALAAAEAAGAKAGDRERDRQVADLRAVLARG